jgi:hypothetical protein
LASGHRATAESIQFDRWERERQEAWTHNDLPWWAWLTILRYVAGYGIGLKGFFVVIPVLILTSAGTLVLSRAPNACRHDIAWRFFASLQRLLPIVEFNKEFKDFFDNPLPSSADETRNLNWKQAAFFSFLALAGWVLGFILLAAMTNLTPKF